MLPASWPQSGLHRNVKVGLANTDFSIDRASIAVKNDGMLPLLFAAIVFIFLALGSLVFVACALVPPARKFALSAALWCAVWGPCSVGFMTLAGLAFIAAALIAKHPNLQSFHAPKLLVEFGLGYLTVGVLITIALATGAARIHQKIVRRFTFTLFRLYATAVSGGIGSVFGCCLGWWLMSKQVAHYGILLWCIGMIVLVVAFATAAYKSAHQLRAKAPASLTRISPHVLLTIILIAILHTPVTPSLVLTAIGTWDVSDRQLLAIASVTMLVGLGSLVWAFRKWISKIQ